MKTAILIGVVLAIVGATRAAHAGCKRGARLFRIESTPIEGGATEVLEVRTTGAWTRTGEDAATGCLSKARLALVKKAVKLARYARGGGSVCDAVPTTNVVYRGARKHIDTQSPCGPPVDNGSAIAANCVSSAVDATISDADVATSCDTAEVCEPGTLLFRVTTTALESTGPTPEDGITVEARSRGAWSRSDGATGCLAADRLTLLKRAVKRAKFKKSTPRITCKALPNQQILYEGAKKRQRVSIQAPCADELDRWTAVAAACLDVIVDPASSAETVATACSPER